MPIDLADRLAAYQKTIEQYPTARIFRTKALEVLEELNQRLAKNLKRPPEKRERFGAIMSLTLDHFRFKKTERETYASLIGFYFGNRGSKNALLNAHRIKTKSPPPVRVRMHGKQSSWDF